MLTVIGVDCASQDQKCGLALARVSSARVQILDLRVREASIQEVLVEWLLEHEPRLIAIDAPLGWPRPLGRALASHRAGEPIAPTPNDSFHRATDAHVRRVTGKRPMEVGADKIARAAHRALRLLGDLRAATGSRLALASRPGVPTETSVIEVYPALNLRARGISEKGYKANKNGARERREEIVQALAPTVDFAGHADLAIRSDDALDAGICALAARDFAYGPVCEPAATDPMEVEGWIWFPKPPAPGAAARLPTSLGMAQSGDGSLSTASLEGFGEDTGLELLDAIPGAFERAQQGLRETNAGKGMPLDEF